MVKSIEKKKTEIQFSIFETRIAIKSKSEHN